MVRKLLLVALTSMSYASALTLTSSDNTVNSMYNPSDFIASDSLTYRLGDYQITELDHKSLGGGEVRFSRIEAIIPYSVFEELSNYEIVYISIPNHIYSYNSTVILNMRIELYDSQGYFDTAYSFGAIPLNETMLAHLGYTVADDPPYTYPPNAYNLFDPALWDYNYLNYEIRLIFTVPYTAYATNPPTNWQQALRDITLFTELGLYSNGYSDGYFNGYDDGFIDGYSDGFDNGYFDGFSDGIQEGLTTAEGTWLGNLIFGTVGSVVGFIFAISDFEVLGVSIMSIITLFVAIGVIMLFIKLIKGTN